MAGRPSRRQALAVWMNGARVGEWAFAPQGGHSFRYDAAWLDDPLGRPLSLSLPMEQGTAPLTGPRVEAFFDNLLPDSLAIRRRIAQKYGSGMQAMALLTHIGRDCVGAIQLLPEDAPAPAVRRIEAEPLDEAAVARMLDHVTATPGPGLADADELRISIAGAQEKTALLWHEDKWCRPLGATPTTHILKLPLGEVGGMRADFSTSVENEWLCARLARRFGLPVAHCEMASFGRHRVLVVERFDRRLLDGADGAWWARLPQEDFCQALGVPGEQKYEERGGPGMAAVLATLRGSEQAAADRQRFLAAQLLFWLLAAPDGHAKNFSLFIEPRGRFRLTPLYDVLSAWPVLGDGPNQFQWQKLKMAMAVRSRNPHYRVADIQRRHWNAVAKANALGEDFEAVIGDFIARAPGVVQAVAAEVPAGFPAAVSEPIFEGVLAQAARLG